MTGNRIRGAARAFLALAALATSLIEVLPPIDPASLRDVWAVQALVEERPTIPDGLRVLRDLGRITLARLRTNARKLAQIIARATRTLVPTPFTLGELA